MISSYTFSFTFFPYTILEKLLMYAVIETGGKQLRVEPGKRIRVEKLKADVGANYTFDRVLLVNKGNETLIGTPLVENVPVVGKVVDHGRGDKIRVIKMKRRKNYRRTQGHRQSYTELEIVSIGETALETASAETEMETAIDETALETAEQVQGDESVS